jgi:stress response protein YsnF
VISKDVRITEEVVVGKEGTDHVETLRDKVRRQEVEVERIPGSNT